MNPKQSPTQTNRRAQVRLGSQPGSDEGEHASAMNDITELPHDIFMLILWCLSPRTCITCRAVSRQWHVTFTEDSLCRLLLRWNYPRCRESLLSAAAAAAAALSPSALAGAPNNLRVEIEVLARRESSGTWAVVFANVARRYHYMRAARPRLTEKIAMAREPFVFRGVATWNRFLRLDDRTANFHYPDPHWTYSQEDGLLVFPDAAAEADEAGEVYRALDLATGGRVPVPFDVRGKYIRRVRLVQGVLIFEFSEAKPYHQLNDREVVHRHFVAAFDVVRSPAGAASSSSFGQSWTWTVRFRSEWKLHFLGLPINRSDRFFSAHTSTHYAVYFWQPNRSLYQDDPIEQLAVWDISSPSPYRPSEDPTGDARPRTESPPPGPSGLWHGLNGGQGGTSSSAEHTPARRKSPLRKPEISLGSAMAGPQVIRRMAWRELDFYGLRQRATPQLRNLALDDRNLYFIEEEHRWAEGQHSSLNPPRVHLVRCTGIPVIPPRSEGSAVSPSRLPASALIKRSAGDADAQALLRQLWKEDKVTSVIDINEIAAIAENVVAKSTASGPSEAADSGASGSSLTALVDGPVFGPMWMDSCGAEGDVNMSFCQRVALPRIRSAPVHYDYSPQQPRFSVPDMAGNPAPAVNPTPAMAMWPWGVEEANRPDAGTGGARSGSAWPLLPQPARWPGWAPCWRHEDFPYLTVSEMVDLAAGVRIAARHCFMLETLSIHVRPKIWVRGPAVARSRGRGLVDDREAEQVRDPSDAGAGMRRESHSQGEDDDDSDDNDSSEETIEAQFPDELWAELLAKGHIAGDERWVVGEDGSRRISVLRF